MRCIFCVLFFSKISFLCFGQDSQNIHPDDTSIIEYKYDTVYLPPDTIRKTNVWIIQQGEKHDSAAEVKRSLSVIVCFSGSDLKSNDIASPGYLAVYSKSPSFCTGIQIRYVKNSLLLQTGLLLNGICNNITESYSFPADGSTVSPDPGSSFQAKYDLVYHNRFYYADIPLWAGYFGEWKSFSYYAMAGPSVLVLLTSSADKFNTADQSLNTLKASEMKRINSFLSTEIGIGYSWNKYWTFTAGTGFRKLMLKDIYLPDRAFKGYVLFNFGISRKFNL